MGGPFDMVVVGAGPTGMLTALLAKAEGFSALVVEARGPEPSRQQLVRLGRDTVRTLFDVGAGERIWTTPFDPARPDSRIVPIRVVEQALRGVAEARGVPVWYGTTLDGVRDLGGEAGATARAIPTTSSFTSTHDDHVAAGFIVDASGGRWGADQHLGFDLRDHGLAKVGIPLSWNGVTPLVAPRADDLAIVARPVLADGTKGSFVGITDAGVGTYGVLEVPGDVDPSRHAALVDAVEAALGTAGHRTPSGDAFEVHNAVASRVRVGNLLTIGDGAGRTDPRNGRGLTTGARDAHRAVELLHDLRYGATRPATDYRWGREAVLQKFAGAVRKQHLDDLHQALAADPFAG